MAAHRPISTRLEPASLLRSVEHWVHFRYTFWPRLDEPAPSGSPGTTSPSSGPLATLPTIAQVRLPSGFNQAAATARREGLSPSSINQRYVAHNSTAKKEVDAHAPGRSVTTSSFGKRSRSSSPLIRVHVNRRHEALFPQLPPIEQVKGRPLPICSQRNVQQQPRSLPPTPPTTSLISTDREPLNSVQRR